MIAWRKVFALVCVASGVLAARAHSARA